jgi:hypothetical protein
MILQLTQGKIKIKPMVVPEPLEGVYVQYAYEPGTNHLQPRMTISVDGIPKLTLLGDRTFMNTGAGFNASEIKLKVELLNSDDVPVCTYEGVFPYARYCVIGNKPLRPDISDYIRTLEAKVQDLEDAGEVI